MVTPNETGHWAHRSDLLENNGGHFVDTLQRFQNREAAMWSLRDQNSQKLASFESFYDVVG